MLSLYTRYLEAVKEALAQEPNDWRFKSDDRYREVLEHTPVEFAQAMLDWARIALPELDTEHVRALCVLNDSVGGPVQQPIVGLGSYAASNMRYLCHAIKLWQHIDSLGLESVDIVEIGGGYGGLALYVDGLRSYFSTELINYTVFDLPEVAELTDKVFRVVDLPWNFRAVDTEYQYAVADFGQTQCCVSAYAFSEFDRATRDWYAERVLQYCRHGLMIWNFPEALKDEDGVEFGGPPYPFVEWPITRVPDEPRLYDGHEMVTW